MTRSGAKPSLVRKQMEARSFAILIGIDDYPRAGKGITKMLHCAVKDTRALKDVLAEVGGFAPENIVSLENEQATRDGIAKGFERAARFLHQVGEGPSRLLVYLAGEAVAMGDKQTRRAVFASWDTSKDVPGVIGLSVDTIKSLIAQVEATQSLLIVDSCHGEEIASGGRGSGAGSTDTSIPDAAVKAMITELGQIESFATIAACKAGEFAWERIDETQSVFGKVLVDGLRADAAPGTAELSLSDLCSHLQKHVPSAAETDGQGRRRQTPVSQVRQAGGSMTIAWRSGCVEANHKTETEALFAGYNLASGHDEYRRCLVVCSYAEEAAPIDQRLVAATSAALGDLQGDIEGLDTTPVPVQLRDTLESPEALHAVVAALCGFDIVVLDMTGFEPGMMLLAGIRAVVRRGVTVCSVGGGYKLGDPLPMPFVIIDVSLAAHSERKGFSADRLIAERIRTGWRELQNRADYADLPAFHAIRRASAGDKGLRRVPYGDKVLALCSFHADYEQRVWTPYLHRHVRSAVSRRSKKRLPEFIRLLEASSPRLVSTTLYEHIRLFDMCLVDMTDWRHNVFFELGVRLAACEIDPVVIIDQRDAAALGVAEPVDKWPAELSDGSPDDAVDHQRRALYRLFEPTRYDPKNDVEGEGAKRMVERFDVSFDGWADTWPPNAVQLGSVYKVATRCSMVEGSSETRSVFHELVAESELLKPTKALQSGEPSVLYPGSDALSKQAAELALERRLAAWLYVDALVSALPDGVESRAALPWLSEDWQEKQQGVGQACIQALTERRGPADEGLKKRIEGSLNPGTGKAEGGE